MNISKTKFDLSPLFSSDDDPLILIDRQQTDEACRAFVNKWRDRDDYLNSASILKEALDDYEAWQDKYGTGGAEDYYFWLRCQQDENDPQLKARYNQMTQEANRRANEIAFFELRLAKISVGKQSEFLATPELKAYHSFLTNLFSKTPYLLSEAEEKIMNLKNSTAYENWVKMLSGFLAKEEAELKLADGSLQVKSFSEILELNYDKDKEVRDGAALALNNILRRHLDTAEQELNSILADKKVNDEIRGYQRPDQSRHISDNIDTEAVDALVKAVSGRFDLSQSFYNLKARLLGMDRLAYHERKLSYGNITKKYSYTEGVALVAEVLKGLDSEFLEIFQGFVEQGAIDVWPKKGKSGGAFCVYILKSQPTYILLNYTDALRDVTTLAHEVGHGINDELVKKSQHALDFGTSTATAEVASTFMEDFVLQQIVRDADDELKLTILIEKLNDMVGSIFRQVALYRFEQELHSQFRAQGYLSQVTIGDLFTKHMSAYMGQAVSQDEGSNHWVYWSHIRRYFYVYSYASGLLISNYLQTKLKQEPDFIKQIKTFLSCGLSKSPRQTFLDLGVDINDASFWQAGLNEFERLLNEATDLAKKLHKI